MDGTRLYLVRHGQVVGFEQGRIIGHTDVGLTALGRAQMEAVAEELAAEDLAAVYSSDLERSRWGGEVLARGRAAELIVEPGFREMNFGQWEGLTFEEIEARYPGELRRRREDLRHYRIPGGETLGELFDRVRAGLAAVLAAHPGRVVALVAHSGVNRAVLLQALGLGPEAIWRIDQSYGCLNTVDYFADGRVMVRLVNGPNRAQGR